MFLEDYYNIYKNLIIQEINF